METVQVRSKDFVVRWVDCQPGSSVSWKILPEKKSVDFGVYQFDQSQLQPLDSSVDRDVPLSERLLKSGGLVAVEIKRFKGGEDAHGEFVAKKSVVAFVFDNTFSKSTGKCVAFSFDLTEPEHENQSGQTKIAPKLARNSGGPSLSSDHRYLSGILLKRRRKKLQGYARRYFSLDTSRGLLNYYLDNRSSSLRGVMPVKICEIDVSTSPQIILDSGVEKWYLKASDEGEFGAWVNALQAIRNQQYGRMLSREPSLMIKDLDETSAPVRGDWKEVASALEIAKNAVGTYVNSGTMNQEGSALVGQLSGAFHQIETMILRHVQDQQANNRALSGADGTSGAPLDSHHAATQHVPAVAVDPIPEVPQEIEEPEYEDEDIFYDAEDVDESDLSSEDSDSDSEDETANQDQTPQEELVQDEESDGLGPLPLHPVNRRDTVPRCEHQPPSLLALIRKSKDLANSSAPVTSNEPISVLQKLAENFEYSELLDQAAQASSSEERCLLVAAFAVSALAAFRLKDRAMRKPFNSMLGEVYELVREDKGFRFLAEKVSHRPPIFASHTESELWHATFTSRPYQKVWGKSAEITDAGICNIYFPEADENIEYSMPDCFLRNLLAGEKYVEPVGTCIVTSDKDATASIEFKAGGMFSGRSEEVKIVCGSTTYEGKWTEQLSHKGKTVWKAGSLVSQPKEHYGWPVFTASLNEITEIEKGHVSPVDSRLRPDQQAYEKQDVDKAEKLKLALEQRQRERRKEFEDSGKSHEPIFFSQGHNVTGNFLPKHGKQNYWTRRQNQDWDDITHVLDPN